MITHTKRIGWKLATIVVVLAVVTPAGLAGVTAAQDTTAQPSVSVSQTTQSGATVAPGETITVEATVTYQEVNSPGIDATLPSGWTVVNHTDDGGQYGPPIPAWAWLEADNDGVNGTHTVTYTVQVPSNATEGTHTISANGSGIDPADGTSVADSDDLIISVQEQNEAPTADAGQDQTVDEGASVSLDASGSSDPDGSIETYSWSQTGGPTVSLSDDTTVQPTFTAPDVGSETTLTFEVAVSDGNGNTDTDTATVTVKPISTQPSVSLTQSATSPTTVSPGENVSAEVTIDYSGVNSPGINVTIPAGWTVVSHTDDGGTYGPPHPAWTWLEGDSDGVSGSHTVTYTVQVPSDATEGTYTISASGAGVNPADSSFVTSADALTITAAEQEAPTANAGSDQTVDEGTTVSLDASGSSDSDGDSLSYSWTQTDGPSVTLSDATSAMPTFTAPEVDSETTLTFEVEVTDDTGATDTDTVTVTVTDADADGVATKGATDVAIDTSTVTNAKANLTGNLTLGDRSEAKTYVRFWVQGQPETTYWYDGENMTQSGEFSIETVLSPSTTYMWQALAESNGDWKVGETKTFTTPTGQFFGATTNEPTEVGVETATLNGEILNLGDNDNATVYFQYWKQGQKGSTLTWYTGPVQDSTNAFETTVELDPNTTYEYRALGQSNEGEWKAGPIKTFTTQEGQKYGVSTDGAAELDSDSASLNGTLTGLGDNDNATVYFQYWKQGQKGSTLVWWTGSSMNSPGSFNANVAGLDAGTTYVFQAYAQSNDGKWTAGKTVNLTTDPQGQESSSIEFLYRPTGVMAVHHSLTVFQAANDNGGI
jgi:hypothetical protein